MSTMDALSPLFRYKSLVDDWNAFLDVIVRPLPTVIWTNTQRISPQALRRLLADLGVEVTPVSWYPGAFRLPDGVKPGHLWPYKVGLFHVQEEVSLLPPVLLAPRPGERVLDMAAAPGGKSAQMALLMENRGTLVANDIGSDRMRALRHVLERLGILNVSTLVHDGSNIPATVGYFDRVLVDAPCSCEGTARKNPEVLRLCGLDVSLEYQGVQKALLRKAVQLCRPGGRVVYSTCTFAPEENEAVVDAVVREFGEARVRVVPVQVTAFRTSPGITEWAGRRFHPSLVHALRVWPHHNDTGGFFIAVLEKSPEGWTRVPPQAPLLREARPEWVVDPSPWLRVLEERFGIPPEAFADYTFLRTGKQGIRIVSRDHRPPLRPAPDAVGMLFMHTKGRFPKWTTAAVLTFGHLATRNVVEVTRRQLEAYLRREDISLGREQAAACSGRGYVVLRHQGVTVGLGLFHPDNGGGTVASLFPKGWMRG